MIKKNHLTLNFPPELPRLKTSNIFCTTRQFFPEISVIFGLNFMGNTEKDMNISYLSINDAFQKGVIVISHRVNTTVRVWTVNCQGKNRKGQISRKEQKGTDFKKRTERDRFQEKNRKGQISRKEQKGTDFKKEQKGIDYQNLGRHLLWHTDVWNCNCEFFEQ